MRIYISGPMTGMPNHNRAAFEAAARRLREQGHFVINPHDLTPIFGTADEITGSFAALYAGDDAFGGSLAQCVMDADLAAVRSCDRIYLLKGWENSRGAKKELAEAIKCGLEVRQEGGAISSTGHIDAQEVTTEATCPRGRTTNMSCVFCHDGVMCSETGEVCPYYSKEEAGE